ncbi:MAG: hypothetical protein ABSA11_09690 [Candidatus Bathyarchaeia archaeon]|jgi:hypothetical protein
MDTITLNWSGPYSLNQTTPKEIRGKKGLYATASDSRIIFVGKALHGKGIFREAKEGRLPTYWEGLRKLKVVSEERPAWYKLQDDVFKHCSLYAGVASREELPHVEGAEKLLIYKIKPIRNEKYIKRYEGPASFQLINGGNPPPGLAQRIQSPI